MTEKVLISKTSRLAEISHVMSKDDYDIAKKLIRLSNSFLLYTDYIPFSRISPPQWVNPIYNYCQPRGQSITFEETTDLQCNRVIKYAETNDLPIVVYWSGGIDSTVIVASIIKNFPKELKKRVRVMMKKSSYLENVYFFENFVKPNFAYSAKPGNYLNEIILHGDPADALWLQGNILSMMRNSTDVLTNHNYTKSYISSKTDDKYAEWLFDYIINDAKQAGITLQSTSDFFWWLNFSLNFSNMCCKHLLEDGTEIKNKQDINSFFNNFILWYSSDLYQNWSVQNHFSGIKINQDIRSYKMPAKNYIFEVDGNQYYRDYATKVQSVYAEQLTSNLSVLFDTGRIL